MRELVAAVPLAVGLLACPQLAPDPCAGSDRTTLRIVVDWKISGGQVTIAGACEDLRCVTRTGERSCERWEARLTGAVGDRCEVVLRLSDDRELRKSAALPPNTDCPSDAVTFP